MSAAINTSSRNGSGVSAGFSAHVFLALFKEEVARHVRSWGRRRVIEASKHRAALLEREVRGGALFVFFGRRRDAVKI